MRWQSSAVHDNAIIGAVIFYARTVFIVFDDNCTMSAAVWAKAAIDGGGTRRGDDVNDTRPLYNNRISMSTRGRGPQQQSISPRRLLFDTTRYNAAYVDNNNTAD